MTVSLITPALGPFLCRPSPFIAQLRKWLLWPRQRELLRCYRMECRQSWRALASTRGSSRLDNGFPDVRYRPRHPGSWIPTKGDLTGSSLLDTAKLLMACTPNGI